MPLARYWYCCHSKSGMVMTRLNVKYSNFSGIIIQYSDWDAFSSSHRGQIMRFWSHPDKSWVTPFCFRKSLRDYQNIFLLLLACIRALVRCKSRPYEHSQLLSTGKKIFLFPVQNIWYMHALLHFLFLCTLQVRHVFPDI
jgi:hypothetical protein